MPRGRPKKVEQEKGRDIPALTISEPELTGKNMGNKIVVGCKLPCGLTISHKGKSIELKGARDSRILNGYGLTENVDEDFFNAWLEKYKNLEVVKKELIFSYSDLSSAQDAASERIKEKTGLEGLDPKKPAPGIKPAPKDDDEDDEDDEG
ncbi:hypothetical protein [Klebsiella pneumoniae]|uniref:hypothetical protein n=1 Tax=Klebsiella pneumoniae TaxID=573 RepID=UPI001F4A6CBB|nr:hypothetical protein [Klebsiella pneumoniae]